MINLSIKFENSMFKTVASRAAPHSNDDADNDNKQQTLHDYIGSFLLSSNGPKMNTSNIVPMEDLLRIGLVVRRKALTKRRKSL